MSLRFFARIINRLLPFDEDKKARAGWSLVKLDRAHPFNRAAVEHDYSAEERHRAYIDGRKPEQTQSESDIELFLDMATLVRGRAMSGDAPGAIELIHEACAFWPIARKFGIVRELGRQ